MFHYFQSITNTSGDSLIGYFARVVDRSTQAGITLAADDNGTPIITVSGYADLAKTDEYGNLSFYVAPGTYHLDIYAPDAVTFRFRVSDVGMTSTQGIQGVQGPTGPADNTYTTLATFKASDITNKAASLVGVPGVADGRFNWETANAPYTADDINIIKADSTDLSVGAWVRQSTESISSNDALGGPSAPAIHSHEQVRRLTYYGFKGNNSALDTEAWRDAIFDAHETNLRKLIVPGGISLVDGQIVGEDNPIPWGLTIECEGRNPDGLYLTHSRVIYSGSDPLFDIKSRSAGVQRVGRLKFSGLFFQTLDPTADVFRFNDPRTFVPDDDPNVDDYDFIATVLFDCVGGLGVSGTAQTGDFITGAKLFELQVNQQCELYNFRRAIDLYGCDNAFLAPRMVGNGRGVHLERAGTFGNNNKIDVPYIGGASTALNSEDSYLVWDSAQGTRIGSGSSMLMEGSYSVAHLYLNGFGTTIDSPLFAASAPIFRLGPMAREIAMTSPRPPIGNTDWAPIVDAPASWGFGEAQTDYRVRIYDAPLNVQRIIAAGDTKGRVLVVNSPMHGLGLLGADEPGIATTKGFLSPLVCAATNFWANVGIGGQPIQGIVSDAGATGNRAIKLSTTSGSGFGLEAKIGGRLAAASYKLSIRNRLSGAITTGAFIFIATKNGAFHQALTIATTTTYGRPTPDTLDLSGWADGDVLSLQIFNQDTGVGMWIDYIALTPVGD